MIASLLVLIFYYQFLNYLFNLYFAVVGSQIFVWVGKGSTQQEKTSSMQFATGFLATSGRPEWTPITRVVEGGEPPAFKSQFSNWSDVTLK
jgi:hypothetical protein